MAACPTVASPMQQQDIFSLFPKLLCFSIVAIFIVAIGFSAPLFIARGTKLYVEAQRADLVRGNGTLGYVVVVSTEKYPGSELYSK